MEQTYVLIIFTKYILGQTLGQLLLIPLQENTYQQEQERQTEENIPKKEGKIKPSVPHSVPQGIF